MLVVVVLSSSLLPSKNPQSRNGDSGLRSPDLKAQPVSVPKLSTLGPKYKVNLHKGRIQIRLCMK